MATTQHDPNTVPNLWEPGQAGGMDDVDQLVYASNLLGSDPRVTNFGGGNTSVKGSRADPLTGNARTR